jgi:hypothetical protein
MRGKHAPPPRRGLRVLTVVLLAGIFAGSFVLARGDGLGTLSRIVGGEDEPDFDVGPHPMGTAVDTPSGYSVAVLVWQAAPTEGVEEDQEVLTTAQVEACRSGRRQAKLEPDKIALELPDGSRRQTSGPVSPVTSGGCIKAALLFRLLADQRPRFVIFRSSPPIRWRVPPEEPAETPSPTATATPSPGR